MVARRAAPLAIAVALALAAVPAAAAAQRAERPGLDDAAAAILVDARDGTPILEKDSDERRSIASTTKLMTALLTLERARPNAVFTAPDYDAGAAESKIDLRAGERMRVRDLLTALMLESANDAAATLAEGISGSRSAFVAEMNARARELGLDDTSYANPIGLDDAGNYSTARDLATLARHLLRDRRFARLVDSPSATLTSGARPRTIGNRNDLIAAVPAVDGVKTGYTGQAGYVLVGSATGSNGARVVSVVLGTPSEAARDADSLALLRYGLSQYRRVPALRKGVAVERVRVAHHGDATVPLVPARSTSVTARRDQRVAERVDAPDELEGEIAAGTRVGTVAVLRDGEVVRRVPLLTGEAVPGAGLPRRIASALGISLTALVVLGIVLVAAIAGIELRRRRGRARAARRRERERDRERRRREPAGKP